MDQRIYHGKINPTDIATNLVGHFNRGNLRVQQFVNGNQITVQIATTSGSQTALSILLQSVEDGVSVQMGQQAWLGVAASLGFTAMAALQNPLNLIGRLGSIAQDIEDLQLTDEVWKVIDETARAIGTGFELSDRLRRLVCEYCNTANPVGESNCIACGAPLGNVQPVTCPHCGFAIIHQENICPNCRQRI
ncbi:MAG TPA: zinc ribbon domain-containing protein [Anaerolineaceae bacterium]|nr:zinc ribbon domain-containing protein [Anaerolineaceae bacterium]